MQKPSLGRVVHYTLTESDAAAINKRRDDFGAYNRAHSGAQPGDPGATGHIAHVGNRAEAGQVYPAQVVRVFDPSTTTVNLQVTLDGTDTYWATSRGEGDGPGTWCWPPRV